MKKAFITGITGQDGFYLASLLLNEGYEVHGTVRRSSSINTPRIDPLISKHKNDDRLKLYYSDLLDSSSLYSLIDNIKPDEVYNLAAQSHVSVSFKNPLYSTQTGTIGSVSLLEAGVAILLSFCTIHTNSLTGWLKFNLILLLT